MEKALRCPTKILEAVRQHSPTKAREAMRIHLQLFQRGYTVLFESLRLSKVSTAEAL